MQSIGKSLKIIQLTIIKLQAFKFSLQLTMNQVWCFEIKQYSIAQLLFHNMEKIS
mgnify:CR=1 FL=1